MEYQYLPARKHELCYGNPSNFFWYADKPKDLAFENFDVVLESI
jgi:hypothetical protein